MVLNGQGCQAVGSVPIGRAEGGACKATVNDAWRLESAGYYHASLYWNHNGAECSGMWIGLQGANRDVDWAELSRLDAAPQQQRQKNITRHFCFAFAASS